MDNRAYHLAPRARNAVAKALREGSLTRGSCETCGETGQAHHDSYYPEKWLSVRWLCPKHHRQWHEHNEPEWPTIYEFHPSDEDFFEKRIGAAIGKPGPSPKPWWRSETGTWCVKISGKRFNLGREYDEAVRKCRELLLA